MGIVAEYNPDLALRDMTEHTNGLRKVEECIPEPLMVGAEYSFLKKGLRLYWLEGELPLVRTDGKTLSMPIASIVILKVCHQMSEGETWTTGSYTVKEIFTDSKPHFNGFAKI